MHSAPYGQACLSCFKSKCRCVAREGGEGCERCHRMQKQCLSAEPIRKRNVLKAHSSAERVAQIEGKLDSLVSLLSSVAQSPDAASLLQGALAGAAPSSSSSSHTSPEVSSGAAVSSGSGGGGGGAAAAAAAAASPMATTPMSLDDPLAALSDADAAAAVAVFRAHMLPTFPFVHFPDGGPTAARLRRERPFLMRAIAAVTTTSAAARLPQGRALKQALGQAALVANQSSLDLLQGLLVYAAWGCDQTLNRAGTLSRMLAMAQSLVGDLRLNKPLPPDEHMLAGYLADFQRCLAAASGSGGTREAALEQQRAVLGCYVLSSFVSIYFAQGDPMRWTPHMDAALRAVAASGSSSVPADAALAFQVRVQLIVERGRRLRDDALWERPASARAARTPFLPVALAQTLQAQVAELRAAVPTSVRLLPGVPDLLLALTHYADLALGEMTFSARCTEPFLATAAPDAPASDGRANVERAACLWRSVHAIRAHVDAVLRMPDPFIVGSPFSLWAQLGRAIIALYRLSAFVDPAWDAAAVRRTVDLLALLDHIADKMDAHTGVSTADAASSLGSIVSGSSDYVPVHLTQLLRVFRAMAAHKLAPATDADADADAHTPPDASLSYEAMMAQAAEGGLDLWLSSVFDMPTM